VEVGGVVDVDMVLNVGTIVEFRLAEGGKAGVSRDMSRNSCDRARTWPRQ